MKDLDEAREIMVEALTRISHKLKLNAYELLGLLDVLKEDIHESVKKSES